MTFEEILIGKQLARLETVINEFKEIAPNHRVEGSIIYFNKPKKYCAVGLCINHRLVLFVYNSNNDLCVDKIMDFITEDDLKHIVVKLFLEEL